MLPEPTEPLKPPKVGVIFNPRSHRNRQAVDAAHALPNVIVASPAKRGELRGVLAGFAEQGVECIAISGGDGTVRDVLTAGMPVFGDRWPPIAVVPAGKTNALNVDLGAPKHWTLAEAIEALRDGKRITRRPLVVRGRDGEGELVGFVFGAGLFTVAVHAGQDAHRLGAFDSVAVVATAVWGIIQLVLASDRNPWRRGAPMVVRVGEERRPLPHATQGDPGRRVFLLAAALERFPMGLRPYGDRTGLKLGVLDHPGRRLMARLPLAAFGWERPWLEDAGMHRCSTTRIEVELGGGFILDGEAFPPGDYVITQGPPLSFVVP